MHASTASKAVLVLALGLGGTVAAAATAQSSTTAESLRAEGIEQAEAGDYERARELLRQAAAEGSARAKIHLGYLDEHGYGIDGPDGERAIDWYARGVEAGADRHALKLAWDHLRGELVEPDREEAERWFRHAIDSGQAEARVALASVIIADIVGGDEARADEARGQLEQALEEGVELATYYLARMYREGLGIERDPERARHYLERGARTDDPQMRGQRGKMQAWLAEMNAEGAAADEPAPIAAAAWAYLAAANGYPRGEQLVQRLTAPLEPAEVRQAQQRAWSRIQERPEQR